MNVWTAPKVAPAALNEIQSYYPEMDQVKPLATGEVRGFGKWMTVKSPVELKTSRSVKFSMVYKSSDLTPQAQAKVGWFEYRVTDKGLNEVRAQITLSREVLLD